MMNVALSTNGAQIFYFTSQYHHGCHIFNLIEPDPAACWFSSAYAPLPQHAIVKFKQLSKINKVGIFLHGENNQNPQQIVISLSQTDLFTEKDIVFQGFLEHRAGDFVFDIQEKEALYCKYEVLENYGGSGFYTTQLYCYGNIV